MRPTYCAECNGRLDPYLPDCPECGAHVPDHEEHHDENIVLEHDEHARHKKAKRKWKLHVPWGLFIILGLYVAGVQAYIHWHDLNSPQVKAALHLRTAEQILGRDNGASAPTEQLGQAYEHLLQALALYPDDRWAHEQIEQVEWQLVKRGKKPDEGQRRRAAMLANAWQQLQAGRKSVLPIGARDEWDVDAVLDFPNVAMRFATLGGVFIILLWAYRNYQDHLHHRGQEDERHLDRREELVSLHSHRKR